MKRKKHAERPLLLERAFLLSALWETSRRMKRTLRFKELRLSWLAVLTTCVLFMLYLASRLNRSEGVGEDFIIYAL